MTYPLVSPTPLALRQKLLLLAAPAAVAPLSGGAVPGVFLDVDFEFPRLPLEQLSPSQRFAASLPVASAASSLRRKHA